MTDLSLRETPTKLSPLDGELFMLAPWRTGRLMDRLSLVGLLKCTPLLAGIPAGMLLLGVLTIAPLREDGSPLLLSAPPSNLGVLTIAFSLSSALEIPPLACVTLVLATVL